MPYVRRMATLTITAKGQITLNKGLLRHLGLKPGDKLDVREQPDHMALIAAAAPARAGRMSDAFGMLHRQGMTAFSVEEMNDAIAESRAEDDARIMAEWRDGRR